MNKTHAYILTVRNPKVPGEKGALIFSFGLISNVV